MAGSNSIRNPMPNRSCFFMQDKEKTFYAARAQALTFGLLFAVRKANRKTGKQEMAGKFRMQARFSASIPAAVEKEAPKIVRSRKTKCSFHNGS